MTSGFSIDFKKVKKQIKNLEQCANDMKNLSNNKLETIFNDMKSSWQGESATAYYKKAEEMQKDILETAKSIEKVAEMLGNRVNNVYNAEKNAVEIIKKGAGFR